MFNLYGKSIFSMADTEILGVCILNDDVNKFNMSGSDNFTMRKCGGILVL